MHTCLRQLLSSSLERIERAGYRYLIMMQHNESYPFRYRLTDILIIRVTQKGRFYAAARPANLIRQRVLQESRSTWG